MSLLHDIDPPWDQRLARCLIRPFAATRLSPNHVTSISLASGLIAAFLYGVGGNWAHLGAVLFVFSVLADHADGELARMSKRTSRFGHYYDVVAGGGVYICLFIGIGIGLRESAFGPWNIGTWTIVMGIAAGIAIGLIFGVRLDHGRDESVPQPSFAGFEIEDVLYLIAPITWFGLLFPFLVLTSIGAPIFLVWQLWQFRKANVSKTAAIPKT